MERKSMREIGLTELKQIELEILKQLHSVCEQQGFRYSLAGGTLLGAVRHKGFIPWDDDIDIFMPRSDYNELIDYCKNNDTPFKLLSNNTDKKYGYLFAKAMAKDTVIIEENANPQNIEMGVYIDIFPIEGLGNTYEEAVKNFNSTKFQRELLVARNWTKFFRSKTRKWYYEPIRFVFFLLSRLTSTEKLIAKIEKKCNKYNFDDMEYVGAVSGAYRLKEIISQKVFDEYIEIPFENEKFKAIKNYDKYLKSIYGDYMKLPPKEKQISHHMFKAYKK